MLILCKGSQAGAQATNQNVRLSKVDKTHSGTFLLYSYEQQNSLEACVSGAAMKACNLVMEQLTNSITSRDSTYEVCVYSHLYTYYVIISKEYFIDYN